jgi:hypothetical protein
MTVLIVVAVNGILFGFMLGLLYGSRHTDRDGELAYVTGHVDGYGKALDDCGEVPL